MKTAASIIMALILISCSNSNHEEAANENQHQNHQHQMNKNENIQSELVREGIIDVEALDQDNNGKIFECPMDWNVLSDEQGDCPVCGMKLKEFTIADVKKNLDNYGYEFKK
jgi:rubrerythrin